MKTALVFLLGIALLSANGVALAQEPKSESAAFDVVPNSASPVQVEGAHEPKSPAGHEACGFDDEFGTQAQAGCGNILDALAQTYGIGWDAPTDPAITMYDFDNGGLRRWRLSDAQALRDGLDVWSRALGGADEARRQLGLDTLVFKLRGRRYMFTPSALGQYIDDWNEIDLGSQSVRAVDFAHELAHRWERHRGDKVFGLFPTYRTLRFTAKFFTAYDATTGAWTSDGSGWTGVARGSEGHYGGARPEEDFAETASHVVMRTEVARQFETSERYVFMLSLMPGLQQP